MVDKRGVVKYVNDLGVAAYLLMHGYTVIGKKAKSIFFECHSETEAIEFEKLILDYQPPNEFYTFDSCLMFLKKINEFIPDNLDDRIHKCVSDLGVAAYLLMHEYRPNSIGIRVIGKKGKHVYFSHPEGRGDDFKRLSYDYLTSQFQTYDSSLMGLKKIGEYMPS
jgi:hypothetical protein